MKRLNKVIRVSLIGFTRLNGFRLIPVLLGSTLLSLHLHAGEATASDALRKIISLDQGWRFQEGWFTIPKRTLVSVWRYRLDEREEASADVMAATGLDTSGPEWGYDRTPFKNKMGDPTLYGKEALCHLSAYSENCMGWSATCEATWKAIAERPWMMGCFVWSGFDYQGEPTPFVWPGQAAISTQFGIMDFCGFPKDSYWYYKSWWGSEPVLHVFPHWNWQGKEGEEIPVWVYSNCDEVELFLNEKSLGKKKMERNGHLEWQVPYAPGKLEARGISQGKPLSAVRETTGEPAGIALEPDRFVLTADGADLAWVGVSVVDDHRRIVPTAGNKVRFSVSGPAKVLGVGNGNPTCHESVKASQISAFNGLCMVLVQTTRTPGDIVLTAESDGLKPCAITLKSK